MANKKEEKVKKYMYIMKVICTECGTISRNPWPCVKCAKETFERVYTLKEVK